MAHDPNAGTVLIVEDDPNTREAMKCLIESHGHVVATARDGNEALSVLRSGMRPCLIVLDLTLPNKDGFQFRRDQRQDPTLSAIPVVVYSGHHDPTQYAPYLHAAAYLRKPLQPEVLLDLVDAYAAPARHAA